MTARPFDRLLLTGAAGALGTVLRPGLADLCRTLRVSDRLALSDLSATEEMHVASLDDGPAVDALVEGVDAIVHFGGTMVESWDAILTANVIGMYNLYQAARRHGVKRIVYASSNHATGFYPTDQRIGPRDPVRPDCLYGVSKTWGESLSRLYFDRYGIETACLRIGSAFAAPTSRRMLATWISHGDLLRLVRACLTAPDVGHAILYGVSRNSAGFWDNAAASRIGYEPLDSADDYRAEVEAREPADPASDDARYQGGSFVRVEQVGDAALASDRMEAFR